MMTTTDPRVVAYLDRLAEAAAGLPPERRAELVDQIRDHIATRLAEPGGPALGEDPVDLTLARLGEPEEIVAAAGDEPRDDERTAHHHRTAQPAPVDATAPRRRGLGGLEAAALVLLLFGGFLFAVGWIVGVVLLWMSPRWNVGEKLLGTLVWPGGIAAPVLFGGLVAFQAGESCFSTVATDGTVVEQCAGSSGSPFGIVLLVGTVLAPLAVAIFLGIRASRRGGDAAAR